MITVEKIKDIYKSNNSGAPTFFYDYPKIKKRGSCLKDTLFKHA